MDNVADREIKRICKEWGKEPFKCLWKELLLTKEITND